MNEDISNNILKRKIKAQITPVSDELLQGIWIQLEKDRLLQYLEEGEATEEEIIQKAQQYKESFGQQFNPRPQIPRSKSKSEKGKEKVEVDENDLPQQERLMSLRQDAISEAYANLASSFQEIVHFRQKALNDQLLKWEEVEDWIETQIQKEEKADLPTHWLSISLPVSKKDFVKAGLHNEKGMAIQMTGHEWMTRQVMLFRDKLRNAKPGINVSTKSAIPVLTLAYSKPDDTWTHRKAIRVSGLLNELKELSESLAGFYGWQEAQGTSFILTGRCPRVSNINARYSVASGGKRINGVLRSQPAPSRRITLEIDPTMTDKQVAKFYRKVRGMVLKKDKKGRINQKPLTERQLELALLWIRQPDDIPSKQLFGLWNMKHKNDRLAYEGRNAFGNFNRDIRKAVDRLFNPEFER